MAGDRKIRSSSETLPPETRLRIRGEVDAYVSRGAHKLKKALDAFRMDIRGCCCIDVGSSTGGFTDVMLRSGASRVYAVDVGYNLLDYSLRSNPKVVPMERVNARFLKPEDFVPRPSFGATDVSFISLKAILPAALNVLEPSGRFVALVKPQFEAPAEDVGEGGIVRDRSVHEGVLREILSFVPTLGWKATGLEYSPITGQKGNIEFLLALAGPERSDAAEAISIDRTLDAAYDNFFKSGQITCKSLTTGIHY